MDDQRCVALGAHTRYCQFLGVDENPAEGPLDDLAPGIRIP